MPESQRRFHRSVSIELKKKKKLCFQQTGKQRFFHSREQPEIKQESKEIGGMWGKVKF